MPTVAIKLSESQKAFADAHVKAAALGSISEYVSFLIQMEQVRRNRSKVERLLQEGVNSGPATPMTDEDWQEIQEEVFGGETKPKRQTSKKSKKK